MRLFRSLFTAVAVLLLGVMPTLAYAAPTAGVSVDVTARINGTFNGSTGLGTPVFPIDLVKLTQVAPGTGTGYADLMYAGERTITASSSENLDLAGGLTSPLGATLTFVKVKAILIVASTANTNSVQVGGAATNTFTGAFADATDIVSIPPGGTLLLVHPGAGWTVTASTGDILKVANSGATTGVTYKVIVIGTSV